MYFKDFSIEPVVPAGSAQVRLVELTEGIIQVLSQDANTDIRTTVEISADFPGGASYAIRRAIFKDANHLGFKTKVWE